MRALTRSSLNRHGQDRSRPSNYVKFVAVTAIGPDNIEFLARILDVVMLPLLRPPWSSITRVGFETGLETGAR